MRVLERHDRRLAACGSFRRHACSRAPARARSDPGIRRRRGSAARRRLLHLPARRLDARLLLDHELGASLPEDRQRDLVAHRRRREVDGVLLAEQRGDTLFELEHRRLPAPARPPPRRGPSRRACRRTAVARRSEDRRLDRNRNGRADNRRRQSACEGGSVTARCTGRGRCCIRRPVAARPGLHHGAGEGEGRGPRLHADSLAVGGHRYLSYSWNASTKILNIRLHDKHYKPERAPYRDVHGRMVRRLATSVRGRKQKTIQYDGTRSTGTTASPGDASGGPVVAT